MKIENECGSHTQTETINESTVRLHSKGERKAKTDISHPDLAELLSPLFTMFEREQEKITNKN